MTSPHFHAIMNGLVTEAEFKRTIFVRQNSQNGYLYPRYRYVLYRRAASLNTFNKFSACGRFYTKHEVSKQVGWQDLYLIVSLIPRGLF